MADAPEKKRATAPLQGLNFLGLMDGVLGGQATDWEPPMAETLESLFPGYEEFEFIDRGGMGAVYSALQRSLERRVAIKILPPEMGLDEAFVERFHQEARLLARLQHPHIVAIHDFGRNASGHLFIVMEYVEGTSLLEVMKRERLTLAKVIEVITQICEALQFAHDHGVIHRDIKPTNILIDVWGRARVADFGLAKLAESSPKTTYTTRTGLVLGTPGYAAPEQRRGESGLDHRADIFSMGVTLYEMLTNHLPVGVFEPPSKKSDSPAVLDKVVMRCLRELPKDRYQKAKDLKAAIESAADKLARPAMQRAIAKRPIVSMMTSVIVGAGFIYLLDALNTELIEKPQMAVPMNVDGEQGPTVVRLSDSYSLVRTRMSWEEARRRVKATAGVEMASFHSQAELDTVAGLLREHGIHAPVWTGGHEVGDTDQMAWDDGSPFDFQAWQPTGGGAPLLISEIQAKNQRTLRLSGGDSPDWIEVYNPGSTPVSLRGWLLRHFTGRYAFEGRLGGDSSPLAAQALVVQPGEYRVIYCQDGGLQEQGLPAFGFQLEAQTGRLVWSDPAGRLVQYMDPGWTRFPADGSLVWDAASQTWAWAETPTPGAANAPASEPLLNQSGEPPAMAYAVLMLPEFGCLWTLDVQRRTAWALVQHRPSKGGNASRPPEKNGAAGSGSGSQSGE